MTEQKPTPKPIAFPGVGGPYRTPRPVPERKITVVRDTAYGLPITTSILVRASTAQDALTAVRSALRDAEAQLEALIRIDGGPLVS